MAKARSKARKPHARTKSPTKAPAKPKHRSLPETSMKKPSKTALPPSPVRTSGQVTPADQPPATRQDTDKNVDLRIDTQAPGADLTTNQGVIVSDDQNSLKAARSRSDAAGGLPPAREDHAFRSRAHSRARRPCPRRGRARRLPGL